MGNKQCCDVENKEYHPTYPENQDLGKITVVKVSTAQPQHNPPQPQPQPQSNSHIHIQLDSKPEAEPPVEIIIHQTIKIPQLNPEVQARLDQHSDLNKLAETDRVVKEFGKEVYVGQLDQQTKVPQGYGKIYKSDASVYLGSWLQGKAQGKGVYIKNDGSFYEGQFHNNKAHGKGRYVSPLIVYEGSFNSNKFEGDGVQKGNDYSFEGEYKQGSKFKGLLVWKEGEQKYEYDGDFNAENQFNGQGTLKDSNGVYEGQFKNGEKHGIGHQKFENGLRYEGEYQHGKKCGKGTIFNFNDTLAYEGDFEEDLPHGEGYILDTNGIKTKRKWVRGIDVEGI